MTASELKKSILQMAVEGKLTEQNKNDEPAEKLLKRIKEEKEKLIKEGKIKKEKTVSEIYKRDGSYYERVSEGKNILKDVCIDEELPFDIPDSWVWVRLGNLIYLVSGTSYNKNDITNSGIRILRGGNIQNDKLLLYDDDVFIPTSYYDEEKNIRKYDIIIVASTGSKIVIGKPAFIENNHNNTQIGAFLRIIRLYNIEIYNYINIIFKSNYYREHIRNKVVGTNINNIKSEYIETLLIPLPPIEEQRRIVEKINLLMPLINEYDELEKSITKLNKEFPHNIKKSVLQYAIEGKLTEQNKNDEPAEKLLKRIKEEKEKLIKEGRIKKEKTTSEIYKKDGSYYERVLDGKNIVKDVCIDDELPFDIPDSWVWVRFNNIVSYSMGKTPPRKENEYWDNATFPWVSIADLIPDSILYETKEKVNKYSAEKIFKNRISAAGTLLMSFKLTVGKVSILGIDAFHNEAIISIYPFIDTDKIMTNYLFLIMPLISLSGDTKTAIKGNTLNTDSLNSLYIPLPPIEEQNRIVRKIKKFNEIINTIK